jgi:hypothetical protein
VGGRSKSTEEEAVELDAEVLAVEVALAEDEPSDGSAFGGHPGGAASLIDPLFKKGDRSLISNYRPVTLLNCDYKLMTKTFSLR